MSEITLESVAVRLADLEQTVARLRATLSRTVTSDVSLLAAQSEAAGRAGWDDPIMDDYDRYDEAMRAQNRDPR